jgi:hypothetical protein
METLVFQEVKELGQDHREILIMQPGLRSLIPGKCDGKSAHYSLEDAAVIVTDILQVKKLSTGRSILVQTVS